MALKEVLTIPEFIEKNFQGRVTQDGGVTGKQVEFANAMGVNRQQVTKWVNGGWIVVDGILYAPKREVPLEGPSE